MRNAEKLQRTATPHLPDDQEVRFRGAAFNAQTDGVTLTRGSMPRREFLRYANRGGMEYPNVMRAAWRAIRKHKRKLLIGGIAIAATAGIVGGGVYGGQYNQSILNKLKLEAIRENDPSQISNIQPKKVKKEMQYAKPVGIFEKMSNEAAASGGNYGGGGAGGGGGGYGSYQKALQAAAHPARKRGRRRRFNNKKKNAGTAKTSSRKTRRGKVTKRRRTRKRINKRGKTSKRRSSKKAF